MVLSMWITLISYLNPLGCAPKDEKVEISTSKIMEGEKKDALSTLILHQCLQL